MRKRSVLSQEVLINTHDVETFGLSQAELDDLRMIADRAKSENFTEGEQLTRPIDAYVTADEYVRRLNKLDDAVAKALSGIAEQRAALIGKKPDLGNIRDSLGEVYELLEGGRKL